MLKSSGRRFTTVGKDGFITSAATNKASAVTASRNYMTTAFEGTGSNTGGYSANYNATGKSAFTRLLDGFVPYDTKLRNMLFKDIYDHDPVAGAAVDIYATMPFSDFYLTGLKDRDALDVFHKSIEKMRIKVILPTISRDYLVYGRFIGSTVFDADENIFSDIMQQDSSAVEIISVPFAGMDPLINLTIPPKLKAFIENKTDPRVQQILRSIPKTIRDNYKKGTIPLEPANTLFIPRRAGTNEGIGVSYFERILPVHIMEKAMIRGSIDQVQRRQRAIMHITVSGDGDDFVPTMANLEAIRDLFAAADQDPTGAIIATHSGITPQEIRCLAGDTLIHTENGLQRIDKLVNVDLDKAKSGTSYPLNIKVKGLDGKFKPTTQWHYQGRQETIKVVSKSGTELNCTKKHKILTLGQNAELEFKRAGKMKTGDFITKPFDSAKVNALLPLNLKTPDIISRKDNNHIVIPKYMTPELAYVLAVIVAEGWIGKRTIQVDLGDKDFADAYAKCIKLVFNKDVSVKYVKPKGVTWIKGKPYKRKPFWTTCINSKSIINLIEQLGLSKRKGKKGASYYKVVPWSILQADEKSKYSFIAAYINGDGCVNNQDNGKNKAVSIVICSQSSKLLKQFKIMLLDMGYDSAISKYKVYKKLNIKVSSASRLYPNVKSYLIKRKQKNITCGKPVAAQYGIPPEAFTFIFKDRFIRRQYWGKTQRNGTWFKNDQGKPVLIEGSLTDIFNRYSILGSHFLYQNYENGGYKKELEIIKTISKSLYKNLIKLFKLKLKFEPIAEIKSGKIQHTFDISMKNSNLPMFMANGIIVHNSASDFFRADELFEYFNFDKI